MAETDRPLVVTGGIGAGKSFVVDHLRRHGWATINTDVLGHEVLSQIASEVARLWPDVIDKGGVNRSRLAQHVFSDPEQLAQLEELSHPRVRDLMIQRLDKLKFPVAIEITSPSFLNSLSCEKLVIDSPIELRRDRALARGMSAADLERRLLSQPSGKEWLRLADFVFENSTEPSAAGEAIESFDRFWKART